MRKFYMLTLVAVMAFMVTSAVQADDMGYEPWMNRVYIQGEGAAILPFEDGLEVTAYGSGSVGYWWNETFATEIEIGFANLEDGLGVIDFDILPILFNLRIDLPIEYGWPLHPYIYGGIGISLNDSNTVTEIDDSFAGQIGAGLEYDLTENFIVFFDLRFFFSQPDIGDDEIDLNSFLVGGGATLQF